MHRATRRVFPLEVLILLIKIYPVIKKKAVATVACPEGNPKEVSFINPSSGRKILKVLLSVIKEKIEKIIVKKYSDAS